MFKPFFLYVGYKYVLSKYDNYFISFVSLMSMLGIALGVAVLITVLSVMNGFNKEIKNNILTFTPHIVMHDMQSSLKNWSFLYKQIIKTPGVISASPYIISQCFILDTSSISIIQQPTVMHGIDPKIVNNKQHQHHLYSIITNSMVIGSFDDLIAGKFNIVLGSNLATSLHLTIGDKVICLISKSNANINEDPNIKEFTVVGIFNTNTHYNNNAFINIKDIAYILKMKDSVSNIHIQVNDAMQSTKIIETLKPILIINTGL